MTDRRPKYLEIAEELQIRALGIPPDQPHPQVVCRSQERFVGGRPNSLQHSYFTLELAINAQALLKSVEIEEGTVAYLQVYKPGANRIRFMAGEVPDEVWNSGS